MELCAGRLTLEQQERCAGADLPQLSCRLVGARRYGTRENLEWNVLPAKWIGVISSLMPFSIAR